jgi:predicted GIY-YIG superfamily endonuclease
VTYLLDTNACIALINGTPKAVRRRFQRAIAKEATVLVWSVVAFELWYGVGLARDPHARVKVHNSGKGAKYTSFEIACFPRVRRTVRFVERGSQERARTQAVESREERSIDCG